MVLCPGGAGCACGRGSFSAMSQRLFCRTQKREGTKEKYVNDNIMAKLKVIEKSRFIDKGEMEHMSGGWVTCNPKPSYMSTPCGMPGQKYVTCGIPGTGRYDYCDDSGVKHNQNKGYFMCGGFNEPVEEFAKPCELEV